MRRILTSAGLAATVAVALVGLASEAPSEPDSARPALVISSDRSLTAPTWAFDVRWWSDQSVAVAAGRDGVFEIPLGADTPAVHRLPDSRSLEYAARIAVSKELVAVAAPFGYLAWAHRGQDVTWTEDVLLASLVDFDVAGDRVLLLGARREHVPGEAEPQWAPEGKILFSTELGAKPVLQARLGARSGTDGKALEMAGCDLLELGAVRFLPDGRYVVVPGVQPGILLYAADGRLLHSWDSTSLGFYDSCDVDLRESSRLANDLDRRIAWWQQHVVLDDLVPWDDGFALLLRLPTRDGARWTLVPFSEDGPEAVVEIPVHATSPGVHLRADSRGGRLALLLLDYEEVGRDRRAPATRPRLVVLTRSGS